MSENNPLILVTGGGGYIGSVLVPHLLSLSYRVRVLDHFEHSHPSLISSVAVRKFEPIRGDCCDQKTIEICLDDVDYVIPLAAIVGAPACAMRPLEAWNVNLSSISILTRLLLNRPNVRVLYPNTNSAYGKTPPGELTTEDSPINPLSIYAKSKQAAEEQLLLNLSDRVVSFRLATAFGPSPKMRLDLLVNDFVYRAVRDGFVCLHEADFRRNFIHVQDIANLFAFGIRNFDRLKGQVFNAGLMMTWTKRALCEAIQEFIPDFHFFEEDKKQDPDQRDYSISVHKLTDAGFICTIPTKQGILELIKLYEMLPPERFKNA